jgi:predicted GIY-YIG superfamily endonuclease
MFYTYVLRCSDGNLYVGSTGNLRRRVVEHQAGRVTATASRLPVTLEYYEACRSETGARLREKQLKTGFGRAYLERRLVLVAPRPQRCA